MPERCVGQETKFVLLIRFDTKTKTLFVVDDAKQQRIN